MTSTGNHHKHPPLAKPSLGEWGRNEIAILGAPCPVIKSLAGSIAESLLPKQSVCYVDADHAGVDVNPVSLTFDAVYTDKIQSRRIDLQRNPTMFERRAMMSGQDLILVNGNHFSAKAQIVLLHAKKLESLQRKADRLTNIIAIVEIDTNLEACPFLKAHLQTDTKVFGVGEQDALISWLATTMTPVPVNGLVLAGGRSTRMGQDKSMMDYHGIPHRDYLLGLLASQEVPAYLSCRADQVKDITNGFPLVVDKFEGLGPYGAILSAMMTAPDNAWLVVATDLPLVTSATLAQLLSHRNPARIATAFHNHATGFPEPLITLWEPKAYPLLLSFLAQGNNCPRKALINSDINLIEPADPNWLINVNTPEDVVAVRAQINI